ncbi:MAG: extracellular solute-binding protein [Ruminococcus sp.]|nr:extracellular solute-binding protein [Ruminococcus sp.]
MKKILALVLALLMVATIFAACGGGTTTTTSDDTGTATGGDPFGGEDNITLKVWAPEKAKDLTEKQCADFIALYPDKTISIEVVAQGEGDAASALLNDPDTAADVFSFPVDQLNKLVRAGVIAEVFPEYLDDVKARNSEFTVDAATVNGTTWAFPETGENGYYLVYDKSVVSDEQAKTLEGVLQACRDAGRKFIMDAGNGFYSCVFPFTGGLTLEGLDENNVQKFNEYNEDDVVNTLVAFSTLFHEYSDIFESNASDKIASGMAEATPTVAAGIDGSWNAATVEGVLGENFGAAKLPTIKVGGQDKQLVSLNGCKLIGVNMSSKFLDAAQVLADYLTGEECQTQRAEEISWLPSNTVAAKSSAVTGNAALSALLAQTEFSVPQVNMADTFWTPMGALGDAVWKTENPTDAAYLKGELEKCIANIKDE